MHDVTLKELTFALPTVVAVQDGSQTELVSSTEFPQEFFGLKAMDQVAVINGILRALVKRFDGQQQRLDQGVPCSAMTHFPMHVGIGVTVRRSSALRIEVGFSYPAGWDRLLSAQKEYVANSIGFLLQTAAISVVNRENRVASVHE